MTKSKIKLIHMSAAEQGGKTLHHFLALLQPNSLDAFYEGPYLGSLSETDIDEWRQIRMHHAYTEAWLMELLVDEEADDGELEGLGDMTHHIYFFGRSLKIRFKQKKCR